MLLRDLALEKDESIIKRDFFPLGGAIEIMESFRVIVLSMAIAMALTACESGSSRHQSGDAGAAPDSLSTPKADWGSNNGATDGTTTPGSDDGTNNPVETADANDGSNAEPDCGPFKWPPTKRKLRCPQDAL